MVMVPHLRRARTSGIGSAHRGAEGGGLRRCSRTCGRERRRRYLMAGRWRRSRAQPAIAGPRRRSSVDFFFCAGMRPRNRERLSSTASPRGERRVDLRRRGPPAAGGDVTLPPRAAAAKNNRRASAEREREERLVICGPFAHRVRFEIASRRRSIRSQRTRPERRWTADARKRVRLSRPRPKGATTVPNGGCAGRARDVATAARWRDPWLHGVAAAAWRTPVGRGRQARGWNAFAARQQQDRSVLIARSFSLAASIRRFSGSRGFPHAAR